MITNDPIADLLELFAHPPHWPDRSCPVDVGAVLWLTELLLHGDAPLDATLAAIQIRHTQGLAYLPKLITALQRATPGLDDRRAATTALSILLDAECLVAEEIERRRLERRGLPTPATTRSAPIRHVLPVTRFRDVGAAVVRAAEEAPTVTHRVVPAPWPEFNRLTAGGLRPGDLCYVAARPAVGKSLATSQWAMHAALHGIPTLIVSREMSNVAIGRRLLTQQSGVPLSALRTGRDVPWERVADTMHRLYDAPLWLTDAPTALDEIVAALALCTTPPRAVFVDYLQLLQRTATRPQRDKRAEVEAVSAGLKALALQRQLAVVVISSVGRPERGSRTHNPHDLAVMRESGQLEHDADIVVTLHRAPTGDDPLAATAAVIKNRDGATGQFRLLFDPDRLTFGEIDSLTPDPHHPHPDPDDDWRTR